MFLRQTWIGSNPKHVTYVGHWIFWFDLRNEIVGRHIQIDRIKGTERIRNYNVDLKSLDERNLPTQTQINIHTDGSMTYTHAGAGYVIFEQFNEMTSKSIRLSQNTMVFQAEILAIREAAKHFNRIKSPQHQYIKIMTDSQPPMRALDSMEYSSKVVKTAMDELNLLGKTSNYFLD